MKVYELLDKPEKWVQRYFAISKTGESRSPHSEDATGWCLYGALEKCYWTKEQKVHDYNTYFEKQAIIQKAIAKPNNVVSGIAAWNDDPDRKYEDVIKLCKELDI